MTRSSSRSSTTEAHAPRPSRRLGARCKRRCREAAAAGIRCARMRFHLPSSSHHCSTLIFLPSLSHHYRSHRPPLTSRGGGRRRPRRPAAPARRTPLPPASPALRLLLCREERGPGKNRKRGPERKEKKNKRKKNGRK